MNAWLWGMLNKHVMLALGIRQAACCLCADLNDMLLAKCRSVQAIDQLVAAVAGLPDDIMERRCPKLNRFNHGAAHNVRVTTRKRLKPYAIKVTPPSAPVCPFVRT